MKIQTVNQLISVFKDISTRHYQINGFGVGDNWENGTIEKMHPVLWINPTTATMPSSDNGYKTFEIDFEVRVFDLVNKDESNEKEVLSDCIDILKDIITEFKGHPYYVNSQLNIIDDINFEAFTEEFDEEVSGWVCEISLMTPVLTSFCGIPSADITGFEFPGVDCPDVNVLCPVFVEDVTGVYPIVVTTTGTTKEISLDGGLPDTFVISGEYDNGTLTLTRNDDVDVIVTGFDTGGDNDYTTSATLSGNIITFDRTDTVGAYSVDLTTAINSAPDKFVQSGAYDEINNKIVLTLNDASTVDIDTSAISGGGGGGIDNVTTAEKSALSPSTGDFVYDTDLSSLQRYDGSNWVSVSNGYGVLCLTSSTGEPTFHTSYTSAISSASSGDTINQYGNIEDSSNTTVNINKSLTINLNGFTYTNSSTGTSDGVEISTTGKVRILNGIINRINGTYGTTQNRAIVLTANGDLDLNGTNIVNTTGLSLYSTGTGTKVFNGRFITTSQTINQVSVQSTASLVDSVFESSAYNNFQGVLYNVKATSTSSNTLIGSTSEARFCEFRQTNSAGYDALLMDSGSKAFYCECFNVSTNYAALRIGGANTEIRYCLGYSTLDFGIEVGTGNPKGIYNCTGINESGSYGGRFSNIDEIKDSSFISISGSGGAWCSASDVLIDSCIFKVEIASSFRRAFYDSKSTGTVRVYNSLVETAGSGAGNDSMLFTSGRTVYLANNRLRGGNGINNINGNSQTTAADSTGNIILD